jgi:hypothetical protein
VSDPHETIDVPTEGKVKDMDSVTLSNGIDTVRFPIDVIVVSEIDGDPCPECGAETYLIMEVGEFLGSACTDCARPMR